MRKRAAAVVMFALVAGSCGQRVPVVSRRTFGPMAQRKGPITLTADDGTGLALVRLKARAVIEGPLAFTELDLTFENPTDRVLEGRFAVELPPHASVSRLAMRSGDAWKEGEVVEKQQARVAYEEAMHQRRDPALLERDAGNRFTARIFPIPARERQQIKISWSDELAGQERRYRLPLQGLPRVGELDVEAIIVRADGSRVAEVLKQKNVVPPHDLVVVGDTAVRALGSGDLVVARVSPVLSDIPDTMAGVTLLVDSSASRARGWKQQTGKVVALVHALAVAHGTDLPVVVAVFDQEVVELWRGPAGSFSEQGLAARRALGASNLARALLWAARQGHERVVLVSDAVATAGPMGAADLRAGATVAAALFGVRRIDVVLARGGDGLAAAALAHAAQGRGAVIAMDLPADEIVKRLDRRTAAVDVQVSGAEWVWPRRLEGVSPGDSALIFARMPGRAARDPLLVKLGDEPRQELRVLGAERALLERAWVRSQIDWLHQSDAPDAREQALELSLRWRVLSDETALVVLETDADYARHDIDRTALADILVVGRTGVEVLHRSKGGVPAPRRKQPPQPGVETVARSQGTTTGAMRGTVTDESSNVPMLLVTVVASSPSLQGTQSEFTDASGQYLIENLPPGRYRVQFFYGDAHVARDDVDIRAGVVTVVNARINTRTTGEVITIKEKAPTIDAGSTKQGITIEQDMLKNVPSAGRTHQDAMGSSFSGSTNIENNTVVDGINTTVAAAADTYTPPDIVDAGDAERDTLPPPPSPGGRRLAVSGRLARVERLVADGDLDAALAAADRWRAERPDGVLPILALGRALEARGDLDEAARAYGSFLDIASGRAEMRRHAAARLLGLGNGAQRLALDALRVAVRQRPDHPSSHRDLAWALVRAGRLADAFTALEAGILSYPWDRFAGADRVLHEELGLIGAAWVRREPGRAKEIAERLIRAHAALPRHPSLRMVLSWETDANDLDLHVFDESGVEAFYGHPTLPGGGALYADVINGYGPECFAVDDPRGSRYRVSTHFYNRGPTGYGLGQLDVVRFDAEGRLAVETRPFAITVDGGWLDLGAVDEQ